MKRTKINNDALVGPFLKKRPGWSKILAYSKPRLNRKRMTESNFICRRPVVVVVVIVVASTTRTYSDLVS